MNCDSYEAVNVINRAIERGQGQKTLQNTEKRYIQRKCSKIPNASYSYYNNSIFIYDSSNNCITVLDAPKWFGKRNIYYKKQVIRNPKKAYSYNLIKEEY